MRTRETVPKTSKIGRRGHFVGFRADMRRDFFLLFMTRWIEDEKGEISAYCRKTDDERAIKQAGANLNGR